MPRFTVTVTDEQAALLEDLSSDGGPYESKSEAVRSFIQDGERLTELEQENDRLHRERRQLLEQRQEHNELVRYVEDEQRYRQAGLFRRIEWWLRGMD
jgi:Arc/MetJ-type ribon-helix-helix transcriptional regulator